MDETLLAAYRATDYRVRLVRGGWCSIRIGAALPEALLAITDGAYWSVITAWNPASKPQPRAQNRAAQQAVLKTLRALPQIRYIGAAWGVGSGPWREASLFVVGPGTDAMDTIARQYGQNAYVHGHSDGPAQLRDCRGSAPHGQGR